MTSLDTVKLPFSLVGGTSSGTGIARDAFNGCTNLKTIEFDFTTKAGKNLGDDNLGESDTSAVTALTHIYQMFAASDNSFGDNTQIGQDGNKPTAAKW